MGEESFEPATLIIACEGGDALFLQHDSAAILARVNDYFGFTAVNKLKLVQKPIGNRPDRFAAPVETHSSSAAADGEGVAAAAAERVARLVDGVWGDRLRPDRAGSP